MRRKDFLPRTGNEEMRNMFKVTLGDFWEFLNHYKGHDKEEKFNKIIDILKSMSDINIPGAKETLNDMTAFKDDIFDEENPFEELEKTYFTKKEAAELFGVSEKYIQRLVSKGLLKPINPRRKPLKFLYEDLEKCFLSKDFDASTRKETQKVYELFISLENQTDENASPYFTTPSFENLKRKKIA